ncbi:sigma-54 dependent transcriptional regulator [Myxococcota bacterium]|nr:sigma-54 dependent transcriptional regulator [Myxococcota bacterium]
MNPNQARLLLVDDEAAILDSLRRLLERDGYVVSTARSAEEALGILQRETFDLLVTDLRLPHLSGLELLRLVRRMSPDTEVILMTAYGQIEDAVEAMKEGAYDFLPKPVKKAALTKTLDKAMERRRLVQENRQLRARLDKAEQDRMMVGHSPAFRHLQDLIRQVASSEATVLLRGESGTGKELAARAIHRLSARSGLPFVAVNCAALPESIIESELFGYVKGAFTGASGDRPGRFRQADTGTLFLDEIGDLAPHLQIKLLRVLQEGEIEPVGADRPVQVNVRLLAATHRNLEEAVASGRFRSDLYYRLNVISITLPPLRERTDDIALLAAHFMEQFNRKNNKSFLGITQQALDVLTSHHWPGNVRELENVIERAVVLGRGEFISLENLPPELTAITPSGGSITLPIGVPMEEIERTMIRETLRFTGGNKQDAARLLGIATRTIYRRLADEGDDVREPQP